MSDKYLDFGYETAGMDNPYLNGRLDTGSSAVADLFGGTVATVADFGVSVANSVTFNKFDLRTEDVLRNISSNGLRVYNENPDTIHTLSFVGGVFAPSALALKGMQAIRNGTKGFSAFSSERRAADIAKLEELAAGGAKATGELRALRTSMYARGAASQMMDVAAMEVAIIGSMSAHPFMEDYLEDPLKNFGISMAIGGAIGGGVGAIADRFVINQAISKSTATAFEEATSGLKAISQGPASLDIIQLRQNNIETLEASLAKASSPLAKEFMENILLSEKALQEEATINFLSKVVDRKADPEQYDRLKGLFANDPRFVSVDKAKVAKVRENLKGQVSGELQLTEEFGEAFAKSLNKKTLEIEDVSKTRIFIPEADAFGSVKDLAHIGRANVLKGVSAENADKIGSGVLTKLTPNIDNAMLLSSQNAPAVDKIYIEHLNFVNKLSKDVLAKSAVSPDDIPAMQAVLARILKARDPKTGVGELDDLRTTLTKAEPKYTDQILQQVFKKGGVSADHHKKMLEFTNPAAMKAYDLRVSTSLPPAAKDMLEGWVQGGGVARMRAAADASLGGYGAMKANKADLAAFEALVNSAETKALKAKFMQLADAEGNVYLWRGTKGDPRGHQALLSYTTDYNKASEFGKPRLYKVHVDDIVGGIRDLKSKDGKMHNEIIVRAPKREVEPTLPIGLQGKEAPASAVAAQTVSTNQVDAQGLMQQILQAKEKLISDLAAKGTDHLEIAIRSNTPVETVQAWLLSGGKTLAEAGAATEKGVIEYLSQAAVRQKLGAANQPLALSSNINKKPWVEYQAKLDQRTTHFMNQEIMRSFFETSKAPIARALNDLLFKGEMAQMWDVARAQLSLANNAAAGTRFIQSGDQFTRHMKELGQMATWMGKELSELSNATLKRMFNPVMGSIDNISKNVVARTELNTALQVSTAHKGWHTYDKGQFWMKEMVKTPDGKTEEKLVPILFEGRMFKVKDPNVDALLQQVQKVGRELYDTRNLKNKILGKPAMIDRGFWYPSFSPRDKFISYLHDFEDGTTRLIVGNTQQEMVEAVEAMKRAHQWQLDEGTMAIFSKADQGKINLIAGRDDPVFMSVANIEKLHSGSSARAFVSTSSDPLSQLVQGLEQTVKAQTTELAEIALYDISDNLRRLSTINKAATQDQPLSRFKAFITKPKDAAGEVRDIMFDLKSLNNYTAWQDINSGFEGTLGYIMSKIEAGWEAVYKPAQRFGQEKTLDYDAYAKLLKKNGTLNPFQQFGDAAEDAYKASGYVDKGNGAKRLVVLANSYAATAALRFGELAHPIVNAMSMPILMTAAIADKMPASFMGAKMAGKIAPAEAMHDGLRLMNNPAFKHMDEMWAKKGLYDPIVSEATKILQLPRELTPGALTKAEKAIESRIVSLMSKPADYSESLTRKYALFTGYGMAKKLYPELGDQGATIFARNFMDRVIGNYHASQRPVFFQGTMGTAMGLFQTYMLTFTQAMYRHLELKNYKALGKTLLAQGGVFGAGSLPGFGPVSDLIGENYSDDHIDLQTGTVRALSDPMAKAVLYGLPSNLGPAFYTRGELAPRISTPANLTTIPPVEMLLQTAQTVGGVASAIGEGSGRSLMQALSLQSVSRPIARATELVAGYSVTGQGSTVQTPEEVWTATGIISRILGARPTEEALIRETNHLNRMYESFDRERRQKVTNRLRNAIRDGDIGQANLEALAEDYMEKGGTPTGWRSAVRTAIITTNQPLTEQLAKKIDDNSALNHMIDMLDE